MREGALHVLRDTIRAMSTEDAAKLSQLLMEPVTPDIMSQQDVGAQIDKATSYLIQHGKYSRLAVLAGDIAKFGMYQSQSDVVMVESVSVYEHVTRAKLIIRTHPIDGARWSASVDTWREGE